MDIQKSQEIAREIVNQAGQGELLEEQTNDAASKVRLLDSEVAFNKSLGVTLEQLQAMQRTLNLIQRAILDRRLLEAVDFLGQVGGELNSIPLSRSTRVVGVLGAKIADLRNNAVEKLADCWKAYISVDSDKCSIEISRSLNGSPPAFSPSDLRLIIFQTLLQWTLKHW